MAEEHHEHHVHHGLAHGEHETKDEHREKKSAMYWQLGIAAAALVLGVLFFAGGGQKKQKPGTNTVVQPSTPFIPNPTDVSIGSNAAHLYWPGLVMSGTPSHPKHHHHGKHHTPTQKHHSGKPNDHKGYGKSPHGNQHHSHGGHPISGHHASHPIVKGHGNG